MCLNRYQNKSDRLVTDMEALPNDIQWFIWKTFYTKFVVPKIVCDREFLWENPSDNLMDLCKDKGCIQQGHHELCEMIEDHNLWVYYDCTVNKCANCQAYGFPCDNLALYGFENGRIAGQWHANFF